MADGKSALFTVYSAYAPLTARVPVLRIINDDALPLGVVLPAIRIGKISGVDRQDLSLRGASVHTRQRIRTEIHAEDAAEADEIAELCRSAQLNNCFPVISGLSLVVIETEAEGPDGISAETGARMRIQDSKVSYSRSR